MITCSGCDCPLAVHVINVEGNTICLTAWTSYGDVRRCDCVNGISESADRFRREEEKKRKDTEAYIESLIKHVEANINDK